MKVHATIVSNGFRLAANGAVKIMSEMTMDVSIKDEELLKHLAMTAMTGKSISSREYLTEIAVKAVTSVAEEHDGKYIVDVDNIKVEKKHGGSVGDTSLFSGIILDKERVNPRMPSKVKDAKRGAMPAGPPGGMGGMPPDMM